MKISRFNILQEVKDGEGVLFNTKTQALVELDSEGIKAYRELNESSDLYEAMMNLGFWVSDDAEEVKELMFESSKSHFDEHIVSIVLKMTNNCNFRCPYCYQEPNKVVMNEEKMDTIFQFMLKLNDKKKRKFIISYFGGEPLLNSDMIFHFEKMLKSKEIDYRTNITTNGYLLSSDLVDKLNDTSIRNFQITVDGPKEIHDKTRIMLDGSGSFDKIIGNIKNLLNHKNNKVTIRCNLSHFNEPYIDSLLEYLNREGLISEQTFVLMQEAIDHDSEESDLYFNSRKKFGEINLRLTQKLLELGQPLNRYGKRSAFCNMISPSSYVINPKLEIESCTSDDKILGYISKCGELHRYGSFYDRTLDRLYEREECLECKVLPMCMGGCSLLNKIGRENCIPQKYIMNDLVLLYKESIEKYGVDE